MSCQMSQCIGTLLGWLDAEKDSTVHYGFRTILLRTQIETHSGNSKPKTLKASVRRARRMCYLTFAPKVARDDDIC